MFQVTDASELKFNRKAQSFAVWFMSKNDFVDMCGYVWL